MLEKKLYANGQPVCEMIGDELIYYYKNGKVKARGLFINNLMEGEWIFYRETGQLWQIANFRNSKKHGSWVRYDGNDIIEFQEEFENNRIIKNKLKSSASDNPRQSISTNR
jgi:antitoxin component YwqK of YwqJK toxin-antitoxin module